MDPTPVLPSTKSVPWVDTALSEITPTILKVPD
jgi:hypothetical protein